MEHFDHERLHVYRVTIDFVAHAHRLATSIKGYRALKDQLHRASTSIANNIAEGAGEFSPREKQRFYRMARRSATECAAILDTMRCCVLVEDERKIDRGRVLLLEIVRMLTALARGR